MDMAATSLCSEITKPLKEGELEFVIKKFMNRACSPIDKVEVRSIKAILKIYEEGQHNNNENDSVYKICKAFITLIKGLLNFNLTQPQRRLPSAFLKGVIIPLFKKGELLDANNYRPITLLPVLYKLLTKVINIRISNINTSSSCLSHLQAAGTPGFSCHTQVNLVQHIFKHSHRTNTPCYFISTDVRKAFDQVPFEAFTQSLHILGFDDNSISLIDNIQRGFQCYVSTPFGDNNFFDIAQGCKQGCALSPLRFNLVYDIFFKYLLIEQNKGYTWNLKYSPEEDKDFQIPGGAFADDLIFY